MSSSVTVTDEMQSQMVEILKEYHFDRPLNDVLRDTIEVRDNTYLALTLKATGGFDYTRYLYQRNPLRIYSRLCGRVH